MNTSSTAQPEPASPARILLVAADDCHFCAQAKAILTQVGREYRLEVEEVSLTSPEGQELAARHGILFPPGLFLDGAFIGFGRVSERKLRRLLEQRRQTPSAAAPLRPGG